MRVMVDTNVIISAILKEGSLPDLVLTDVCENHELILCDYIISESYEVAQRRFPSKIDVLDKLFAKLRFDLVPAPRGGNTQSYPGVPRIASSYIPISTHKLQ